MPCICCDNKGKLPHLPGMPEAVPGDVVLSMCDQCIAAAFMGDGKHPHELVLQ